MILTDKKYYFLGQLAYAYLILRGVWPYNHEK